MKKITLLLFGFLFSLSFAQAPANYYNGTAGLSGPELKTKLSAIITAGAQDKGYNGLYNGYPTTDTDHFYENDGSVLDMYSENPTAADPYNYQHGVKKCGNYSNEGDCYNREHVVPQSFFNSNAPMVSDINFIRPTDGKVNGMRSNYPYGAVANPTFTSKNGTKVGPSSSLGYTGTVCEPINEFKGDFARMVLYFVTRYESRLGGFSTGGMLGGSAFPGLQNWEKNVMVAWSNQDPVSPSEIERNNASYVYQNNRNPFIDHPEWVDMIWAAPLSTTDVSALDNKLSVFPNPVRNGEIQLSGKNLDEVTNVQIYSVEGKLIQTIAQELKTSTKISVKNLPKGVYLLKAGTQTARFIVE